MQGERLQEYELELAAAKTRVMRFSSWMPQDNESFEFLGFEFRWGRDRQGKPYLKRQTSRKKYRRSLQRFTEWCNQTRHLKNRERFAKLNRKLMGYYNHYGLPGNYESLKDFFHQSKRILFKWLNRRSQKRSYTWDGFSELLDCFKVPHPRITDRKRARTPGMMLADAFDGSEYV